MKNHSFTTAFYAAISALYLPAAAFAQDLDNGSLGISVSPDSGAISAAVFLGEDFFNHGTFVSNWGLQIADDGGTFARNTATGGADIPVTVAYNPGIVTVTGTFAGDVTVTRVYTLVPGKDALRVETTLVNEGEAPLEVILFETFDPDQGVPFGLGYDTFMDVSDVTISGTTVRVAAGAATNLYTVALAPEPGAAASVASGYPFEISDPWLLDDVLFSPFDAEGDLIDEGFHIAFYRTLPPGTPVTVVAHLGFGTNPEAAFAALGGTGFFAMNLGADVIAATGTSGASTVVSGMPPGVHYRALRVPAINTNGEVAFAATLRGTPIAGNKPAIMLGRPPQPVALKGDPAPGVADATFAAFGDPALGEDSGIAFRARIAGPGITGSNNIGIWFSNGGPPVLAIRKGDVAPGTGGATFRSLLSFAVSGNAVLVVAKLVEDGVFVTADNDIGTWYFNPDIGELELAFREGDPVGGAFTGTLKSFKLLGNVPGSPGQGRGWEGHVAVFRATTTEGVTGIVGWTPDSPIQGFFAKGALGPGGVTWGAFGQPDSDVTGSGFVFRSTLKPGTGGVTAANNSRIFSYMPDDLFPQEIVREGDPIPDGSGDTFKSFRDPLVSFDDPSKPVAFVGFAAGPSVTSTNRTLIAMHLFDELTVVARAGDEAPGTGGGVFKTFRSVALPNNNAPLFIATLTTGPGNTPGPGGVTKENDLGLWYGDGDFSGSGLLVRENSTPVVVDGVFKTVKSFLLLNAVAGSQGARRSFNASGTEVTFRATFTDKTQAIIAIPLDEGEFGE